MDGVGASVTNGNTSIVSYPDASLWREGRLLVVVSRRRLVAGEPLFLSPAVHPEIPVASDGRQTGESGQYCCQPCCETRSSDQYKCFFPGPTQMQLDRSKVGSWIFHL